MNKNELLQSSPALLVCSSFFFILLQNVKILHWFIFKLTLCMQICISWPGQDREGGRRRAELGSSPGPSRGPRSPPVPGDQRQARLLGAEQFSLWTRRSPMLFSIRGPWAVPLAPGAGAVPVPSFWAPQGTDPESWDRRQCCEGAARARGGGRAPGLLREERGRPRALRAPNEISRQRSAKSCLPEGLSLGPIRAETRSDSTPKTRCEYIVLLVGACVVSTAARSSRYSSEARSLQSSVLSP